MKVIGDHIDINTTGKTLVLPTEDAAILPSFNQSVLDSNRLTIAESPFGGLKGSGSPDYCVGTVYTPTDGVYLSDINGTNSTKTLTAGKLAELEDLSVDTTNHKITSEFRIRNDGAGSDVQVIDDCSSANGWGFTYGSGTIAVENNRIKVEGTADETGSIRIQKTVSLNLSAYQIISCSVESNVETRLNLLLRNGSTGPFVYWNGTSRFLIPVNSDTKYVLALKAPQGVVGAVPTQVSGTVDFANVTILRVGVMNLSAGQSCTFYIDNITACNGTLAQIEVAVPDNLSASSLQLYTHNGSTYQLCRTDSLDGAYANVSGTSANCTMLDGTKFDDVYGTSLGRAVFPKGSASEVKSGSSGTITYSTNKGTSKRIGLKFLLPPSDNGRTNFNQVTLKVIIYYAAGNDLKHSAKFDFADSTNTSYGLQNLTKPWIALYDPANSLIDFYLFTHRPQNLSFKRDETGTIYSLSLYPGAGSVYHGQIPFADLTRDTNSDSVPDCLEVAVDGSVTKFLANYSMVI